MSLPLIVFNSSVPLARYPNLLNSGLASSRGGEKALDSCSGISQG